MSGGGGGGGGGGGVFPTREWALGSLVARWVPPSQLLYCTVLNAGQAVWGPELVWCESLLLQASWHFNRFANIFNYNTNVSAHTSVPASLPPPSLPCQAYVWPCCCCCPAVWSGSIWPAAAAGGGFSPEPRWSAGSAACTHTHQHIHSAWDSSGGHHR